MPNGNRPARGLLFGGPKTLHQPGAQSSAFQKRVLEEAQDPHNPLLERVKFLSIFGSKSKSFYGSGSRA